ncbi:MAG: hypothetical protein ACLTXL_12860 [Clostridia bacterium]
MEIIAAIAALCIGILIGMRLFRIVRSATCGWTILISRTKVLIYILS